jgi:hypothetical protein
VNFGISLHPTGKRPRHHDGVKGYNPPSAGLPKAAVFIHLSLLTGKVGLQLLLNFLTGEFCPLVVNDGLPKSFSALRTAY